MSAPLSQQTSMPDSGWKPNRVSAYVIEELASIPSSVVDLESFRHWSHSEEHPEAGRFSFLHGDIWVDLSMEQLLWHNQVRSVFTIVLGGLVMQSQQGMFFPDRALLSNTDADLSTEPDATFAFWESFQSNRILMVEGSKGGFVELEGSPDMVLEVVSDSSVRKDTEVLPQLYARAGITEYWIVDVRRKNFRFDILQLTTDGYGQVPSEDGWLPSTVFSRSFRLQCQTDPLGNPQYTLDVKNPNDG